MNILDSKIMRYLCVSWRCWCMDFNWSNPTDVLGNKLIFVIGVSSCHHGILFLPCYQPAKERKILCIQSLPNDSSAHCQILCPCSPHHVTGNLVQGSPFERVSTFLNATWKRVRDDLWVHSDWAHILSSHTGLAGPRNSQTPNLYQVVPY